MPKREPRPYIRQVPVEESTGFLRQLFDEALARAGRVWRIVQVMSVNPRAMDASLKFYGAIMFGRSPLSRVQREMLAVVTSKANDCFY
jgi:alkylhydroperoxidase family enzyme